MKVIHMNFSILKIYKLSLQLNQRCLIKIKSFLKPMNARMNSNP